MSGARERSDRSGYFFFQAEDGIRDVAVTGVQTCALPIYLVAIEGHRGFESERVARGEAAGKYAVGRAVATGVEHLLPESFGPVRRGVDLEAVLARVARARDDRGHAVNTALAEVVILYLFEWRPGERLKYAERFGALERDLAEVGASVRERDSLV